jgi:very-short-patch-repair endonuclease
MERPLDDDIDIILVGRRRDSRLATVNIHRPTDDAELVPQRRSNIPCTNILRTLCDLGAVDAGAVSAAVGHALSARLANLAALESSLALHARPGRAGVRALRAAIDEWSIDGKPSDSMLESAMARLIDRYRLPAVEFHPVIIGWEVDFRITGTAVLLECDGWTSHGLDRDQFERDRRRDDDLRAAGWIVMRLSYRAIVSRPSDTARRIRRIVERWSSLPPPPAA